jgi:mannose-6-phosphate isomerase-like protein (cupin superfamily)
MQTIEKANLQDKFSQIQDFWNPRVAGELNGQQVKLAKFKGAFDWHHHEHEDEFFLVVSGSFEMHLRDKVITLNPGEFIVIPRGVEHRPVAPTEAEVLMFEPASTINTGNLDNSDLTRTDLQKI